MNKLLLKGRKLVCKAGKSKEIAQKTPFLYGVFKFKEKKMAKKRICLGILIVILVFGITVVGCDTDLTDEETASAENSNQSSNNEKDTFYYNKTKKELYLRAQSSVVMNTGDGLKLQDFFTGTLKKYTWYTLQASGTVDVSITGLYCMFFDKNWTQIGSSGQTSISSVPFNITFLVLTRNNTDLNPDQVILQFQSSITIPDNIPDGTLIATISNFLMTITEEDKSNRTVDPQIIGKWVDENYKNKGVGFEFISNSMIRYDDYNYNSPDSNSYPENIYTINNLICRYESGGYIPYSITENTLTIFEEIVAKKVEKFSWE